MNFADGNQTGGVFEILKKKNEATSSKGPLSLVVEQNPLQ